MQRKVYSRNKDSNEYMNVNGRTIIIRLIWQAAHIQQFKLFYSGIKVSDMYTLVDRCDMVATRLLLVIAY